MQIHEYTNKKRLNSIIYSEVSYKLNGVFFTVHNELGCFCKELQYCDAIEKVLIERKISYKREFSIKSNNELIKDNSNRVDFLIEDKIVIEVKAKKFLGRDEYNQMQRYLAALNMKLGIIVNFHQRYLVPKRIVNSKAKE